MNTQERLELINAHWHHMRGFFGTKTLYNLGHEIDEMSAMLEAALSDQDSCVMEKQI